VADLNLLDDPFFMRYRTDAEKIPTFNIYRRNALA